MACAWHVHGMCTRGTHVAHTWHTRGIYTAHIRPIHGVYTRGICMPQGERAAVEGFSLLAEDYVPGATSEAALLSYYDFEELSACDAWLAHYLADEDGFKLAAAFEGCSCLKLRRSLDTPTKVPPLTLTLTLTLSLSLSLTLTLTLTKAPFLAPTATAPRSGLRLQ